LRSLSTMSTVSPQTDRGQAAWAQPTSPGRTSLSRRLRQVLGLSLSVALVAAAWWLLAPVQLGGSTSLTTVDGTSMLPALQRSDLVALRATDTYHVGDIAGYRSTLLGRVVLHRIVAVHAGRYSFKGDHNTFVDPERPTREQLVGKYWFRLPRAGHAVDLLHTPWIVAAIAALLVFALAGGTPSQRHRDPL
jgi:signal peptidase I